MAEYAGGFGAGFAPGLAQAGSALAMIPLLRQQAAEREDRRAQQRVQTLGEVLKLPRNLRGPYLDALVANLGIDPVIAATIKRADDDQAEDLYTLLNQAGVENARVVGRVLGGGSGGTTEVMKFLGDFYKTKREQEHADKISSLVPSLSGPATPPGYSFERDVPPVAPPPQALPQGPEPLAGPAAAPPAAPMTGTGELGGVAGPPPAPPRPAPIDLRPPPDATGALRDVHQRRLDMYQAEMRRLGEFTRAVAQMSGGGIPEAQQRFIASERQRIEGEHKPFIESLGKRLDTETAAAAKAKEPLTEPAKLFADRARALAAGRTREVTVLDARIDSLGEKVITEFDASVRGLMPGKTLLTMGETDWPTFNKRREEQRTREAAAIGLEARKAELTVPRPTAGKEIETLASHQSTLGLISGVEQTYRPEFAGMIRGRVSGNVLAKSKQALPGELAFRAKLQTYSNETSRLFLGMAQSVGEAQRMIKQIPQVDDEPEYFESKLEETQQNAWRVYTDYYNALKAGNVDVSRFTPPGPRPPTRAEREAIELLRKPKGSR